MLQIGLIFLLNLPPASACLNTYYTSLEGARYGGLFDDERDLAERIQKHPDGTDYASFEVDARKRMSEATPEERWMHESDVAVAMLRQKKIAPAREIFERLAKDYPKEYTLAANLGTAYELEGRDEEALKWVKKGIELEPSSHFGTEWLHVKILEAKLGKKDSILGADFGSETKPRMKAIDRDSQEVIKALTYQLRERISFVKPPDPYVGDLLFDFSNLVALERSVEAAKPLLELALRYGVPPGRQELAERRLSLYKRLLFFSLDPMKSFAIMVGAGMLLISFAAIFLLRKLRRRRAR